MGGEGGSSICPNWLSHLVVVTLMSPGSSCFVQTESWPCGTPYGCVFCHTERCGNNNGELQKGKTA